MDHIGNFLRSKKPSDMDEGEQSAKMQVLGQLLQLAQGRMGDDIKGMKQVTVAAPDKAGLEIGLDKAKDITGNPEADKAKMLEDAGEGDDALDAAHGDVDAKAGAPADDDSAGPDTDDALGDLKPEEIDALIQALQAKKSALAPKI